MGNQIQKKYDALDGLRTVACIGIVSMHMLTNTEVQREGFLFKRFIPSMTNIVFLFMVISAFGMCCGYYNKFINGDIDLVSFYRKRYRKILPFFALLSILDVAFSPSKEALYEAFANITMCFGYIPNANISVIGVGWFLGLVFVFYISFPFFCFLLADKRRAWVAFAASYIMNYLCRFYFDVHRESIAFSFVFFMAGGMVFLYKDLLMKIPFKRLLFGCGSVISAALYYKFWGPVPTILPFVVFALLYAMSIEGWSLLDNAFTKFIGGISFEIYLCHMLIYRAVEKAHLTKLTNNVYVNYFMVLTLVLIGAVVFSVVAKKFINLAWNLVDSKFGKNSFKEPYVKIMGK